MEDNLPDHTKKEEELTERYMEARVYSEMQIIVYDLDEEKIKRGEEYFNKFIDRAKHLMSFRGVKLLKIRRFYEAFTHIGKWFFIIADVSNGEKKYTKTIDFFELNYDLENV